MSLVWLAFFGSLFVGFAISLFTGLIGLGVAIGIICWALTSLIALLADDKGRNNFE